MPLHYIGRLGRLGLASDFEDFRLNGNRALGSYHGLRPAKWLILAPLLVGYTVRVSFLVASFLGLACPR